MPTILGVDVVVGVAVVVEAGIGVGVEVLVATSDAVGGAGVNVAMGSEVGVSAIWLPPPQATSSMSAGSRSSGMGQSFIACTL